MSKEIDTTLDKAKTPFSVVLGWLGAHRDGFLVGGAVLYGLGYLVWSYNAWRNHLGQLPAAEFQYLIAGIIPMILIALAWAGAAFFNSIRDKTIALFTKYRFLRWTTLIVVAIFQLGLPLVAMIAEKRWINLGWTRDQILRYGAPMGFVVIYLSLVTQFSSSRSGFWSKIMGLYRYLLPVLFCWYSLVIYFELYPRLPQELGGPQPRCAYVDLVRDDTALSTISALVPGDFTQSVAGSGPKVVHSKKLNVYFSSSDYLLVRVADDAANDGAKLKDVPLYELRKEVIRVVEWCR